MAGQSEADIEEYQVCIFEIGVSMMQGFDWRMVARHDGFDMQHSSSWGSFLEYDDHPQLLKALRKKRLFVGNLPSIVPRLSELGNLVDIAQEEIMKFNEIPQETAA